MLSKCKGKRTKGPWGIHPWAHGQGQTCPPVPPSLPWAFVAPSSAETEPPSGLKVGRWTSGNMCQMLWGQGEGVTEARLGDLLMSCPSSSDVLNGLSGSSNCDSQIQPALYLLIVMSSAERSSTQRITQSQPEIFTRGVCGSELQILYK